MRLARLSAAALLLSLSGCSIVHSFVYQPPSDAKDMVVPNGAELVSVTTRDGFALKGLAVPAQPGRPTLLVFNGNATVPAQVIEWLKPLTSAGYGIVAAGYRGYAGNPGRPDEAGLAADADAFHAEARRRAGSSPLIIFGHSLGGGVALGLAERERSDAVVTVGTFSRLRAMAPRLARAMVRDRYDNLAAVARVQAPLFIVHALDDNVVPATEGNLLHRAAASAGAQGGSFVLQSGGHVPSGTDMLAVLSSITAQVDGRTPAPPSDRIQFISFR